MHFMTIVVNSIKYKFFLEKGEYWVEYADNDYIHYMTREELDDLLKFVFSSDVNYSHHENGYEIYLDSVGNKRYFKDGKEDYYLFFMNNGTSAIEYQGGIAEKLEDAKVKRIIIEAKKLLISIVYSTIIMGSLFAFPKDLYREPEVEVVAIEKMDVNEVLSFIENSPNLSIEQKEYFKNIEFFVDAIEMADPSRAPEFRKHLENLKIIYITPEIREKYGIREGISCVVRNNGVDNVIFLLDDSQLVFDSSAAHELIHLLQDANQYIYVQEASAEMMADEYFGSPSESYEDARANIIYLMEIIGPKPVMECNFKGDTSSFEGAVREYLSIEEANELLIEFCKRPKDAAHDKIRSLLEKMVEKKFENQGNVEEQKKLIEIAINAAKNGDRYYFNQRSSKYFESLAGYYGEANAYNGELNDVFVKLTYSEELSLDMVKSILNSVSYNNSSINILSIDENGQSSSSSFLSIKEFKEEHPNDYYQSFLELVNAAGPEYKILLNATINDNKEIFNVLSNPIEGINYYAVTEGDNYELYNVDGVYTIFSNHDYNIQSVADKFPEQVKNGIRFEEAPDDSTFVPFNM